jgi:hypothetical protein
MPRYVVHVGPHKTGSTYLQACFGQLRSYLAARGIVHPDGWSERGQVSQHLLFQRLRAGDPSLAAEFAALNASAHEIVLLSAEDLADLTPDEIARLGELIGSHPVDIVFYCRRWSELLISGWRELVKHGHTLSFPVFLARATADPFASHVLNFRIRLDRFAHAFGRESIHLVSYNHLVEQGVDLLQHFTTRFLRLPEAPAGTGARVNASLDPVESEMIRVLHDFHQARGGDRDPRLTVAYLQQKAALDIGRPVAAMRDDMRGLAIDEDAAGFRALHQELLGMYGDRLVEPRPPQQLFTPRRADLPFVAQSYLLADGVLDAIAGIHRQLADTL